MKKLFVGILSFVYITIASGVAVNMHYCMGKLSGVDYTYNNNDKCGKCGMAGNKGCCHSEFKIVKLAVDQQLAKANIDISQAPAVSPSFFVGISQSIQGVENFLKVPYHSPPDNRVSAVYLYNCVFRI